ncbi:tRNA (adenosine(37)-N6)-threonylcarbamoyltransferase complex dimerization subunit type 1 TsaB [Blastomonas fulva]|uniref:tRNA (adenosine(37)-N6)-threonylcarbamoyltransferase complex dimerization subunit type 1 TsaB n=1 Tax=Blastomonas fulva TaxID=1550728 RepID=UPI003F71EB41
MTSVLGISTSSPALSCAVFDANVLRAADHRLIGRGHAEQVVPAVAALLAGGRVDAIVVDIGPGSFTGIRVGIAAARALGLAWGVPVTGVTAAALVAAAAFARAPEASSLLVLLDAGRGQLLCQPVARDFTAGETRLLAPESVVVPRDAWLAGAGAAMLPPGHAGRIIAADPPAMAALMLVPPAQRRLAPEALYVRPADAAPASPLLPQKEFHTPAS